MLNLPLSFTWADLIDTYVAERGSLAELARSLCDLEPEALPEDPTSVERGLRRLRGRTGSGDRYGRMLLRHFGLPGRVADWAREMGQYHSRLSELPIDVRSDQLRLWDRPPVSESAQAAWVHIGLATLAHRQGDRAALERRLELAELGVRRAGRSARVELDLFRARLATDQGAPEHASALLDGVAQHLEDVEDATDRLCLEARLVDQRAYLKARCWREQPELLPAVETMYRAIPATGPAFVRFRRHQGLAWCLWRQGRPEAIHHAALAAQAAGDGGYLRLRCIALGLQAHVLGPGPEADELQARVRDIKRALGEGADVHDLPDPS